MPIEIPNTPLIPSKEQSVQAAINFNLPKPTTQPGEKWYTGIDDTNIRNFDSDAVQTTIYDMRGQEKSTHIDATGFQALTSPSAISADVLLSGNNEKIKEIYYPEVEALLLKSTGAFKVVFFDHTIRKNTNSDMRVSDVNGRKPVLQAHVDQTPASSHTRITRHVNFPLSYKRFQLVNVWRPIANNVYDYPLAVCDSTSVDVEHDLEPTTLVYSPPTPNGEIYSVRHNKNQVWWYWSEMTPDDVLLLKCYDSASRQLTQVTRSAANVDVNELRDVAGLTPHTSFLHAEGAKKGIARQSIEVRALVFYD